MSTFLTTLLVAALTSVLMRWLMQQGRDQSALPDSEKDSTFELKPSNGHRWLMIGGFLMMLVLCGMLMPENPSHWKGAVLFGSLLVAPFGVALYALRRRIRVSDLGLTYRSPWTGEKSVTWAQVESVRFREWGQTIRIRAGGKDAVVIPVYYAGIAQLEPCMREHLTEEIIGSTFYDYHAYLRSL